jgi:hypothetical protein
MTIYTPCQDDMVFFQMSNVDFMSILVKVELQLRSNF